MSVVELIGACGLGASMACFLRAIQWRLAKRKALRYICENPGCDVSNLPVEWPYLTVRELRELKLVEDCCPRQKARATALGYLKGMP